MKKAKLSVIIPIFGVEEKIERCAISLFEQSLQDIEYVFVDDATKDNSIGVLESIIVKYPERKPWIKIVHHKENKGLPIARETGLRNASGDYIIHCDSDDWMDKQMCEKLLRKAIDKNSDIVFCDYSVGPINQLHEVHKPVSTNSNYQAMHDIVYSVGWQVWRFICKASLYNNVTFPQETNGEDLAITSQILLYARKISYLPEVLYNYVIYDNSSSHNSIPEKIHKSMMQKKHNTDIALSALSSYGQDTTNEQLLIKIYCRLWNKSKNKEIVSKLWWEMYPEIELHDIVFNTNIPGRIRFKYLLLFFYFKL